MKKLPIKKLIIVGSIPVVIYSLINIVLIISVATTKKDLTFTDMGKMPCNEMCDGKYILMTDICVGKTFRNHAMDCFW